MFRRGRRGVGLWRLGRGESLSREDAGLPARTRASLCSGHICAHACRDGSEFWDPRTARYGLFDLWSFRHLCAVVSSGLGGGSLIYANVLIRKDEHWSVRDGYRGEAYEYWPVTRATLDPYDDVVE
jgi:hypothetical protein